jgi:predicted nucleic acid-binding protein
MFVLDTNVVSELRNVRPGRADANIAQWADSANATSLYLSAITLLELEQVLQIERPDDAPFCGVASTQAARNLLNNLSPRTRYSMFRDIPNQCAARLATLQLSG